MAIYTRYGSKIEILRTTGDGWCIVRTEDGREREWHISEFKADGGLHEINDAIAALEELEDNRVLGIADGQLTTAQHFKDAVKRLRTSKGRVRRVEDDDYSSDCPYCLHGHRHTNRQHEDALRRNEEASRGDW